LTNTQKNAQIIAKILVTYPKEISSREKVSLKEFDKKVSLDKKETILQNVEFGRYLKTI
jgi:hypothetical protein